MSQTRRRILFRPASVLLLGALAMLLAQSVAHAGLTITGGTPEGPGIGDPGGTSFSNPDGSAAGKGLPTVLGGWPDTPNFAPDSSFGGNRGISGVTNLGATLTVSLDNNQAGPVSFTFFGKGDATQHNEFLVNPGSGFQLVFDSNTAVQGQTATFNLPAGRIPFEWIAGTTPPTTVENGSSSAAGNPGFFAGVGPYPNGLDAIQSPLASGVSTVFVGLTDRIAPSPGQSDHDFQDLTVRITSAVPEPASLIMGSTAAVIGLGCAWSRRKRQRLSHASA